MHALLSARVWWPQMRVSCSYVCQSCQVCQYAKDSTQAPPGLLEPLPIAERRFVSWSMDFITRLPSCSNDYNAIFTCVDCLINYTILTACTLGAGQLSVKQVAQLFFQGVIRLFGLPENVVHDRDPYFTAEFWTELWYTLGSREIFSSAYYP